MAAIHTQHRHFCQSSSAITTTAAILFLQLVAISASLQTSGDTGFEVYPDAIDYLRERASYNIKLRNLLRLSVLLLEKNNEMFPVPEFPYETPEESEEDAEIFQDRETPRDNFNSLSASILGVAEPTIQSENEMPDFQNEAASSQTHAKQLYQGVSRLKSVLRLLANRQQQKQQQKQKQDRGEFQNGFPDGLGLNQEKNPKSDDVISKVHSQSKRGRHLQGAMAPMNEFCRMMGVSC